MTRESRRATRALRASHRPAERRAGRSSAPEELQPARPMRREQRIPEQADRDRHDAHVEADEREQRRACALGRGVSTATGNLVIERHARRRQQPDDVRFTVHPRIRNRSSCARPRCASVVPDPPRTSRTHRRPHLRNGDRIRTVVEDRRARCRPGDRSTRVMASRSTGGSAWPRAAPDGPPPTMSASSAPSSTSGTSASAAVSQGERDVATGASAPMIRTHDALLRPEQAHPPELGELALVRVEHEIARIAERRLENRALALAQHHRVGVLARLAARARCDRRRRTSRAGGSC